MSVLHDYTAHQLPQYTMKLSREQGETTSFVLWSLYELHEIEMITLTLESNQRKQSDSHTHSL